MDSINGSSTVDNSTGKQPIDADQRPVILGVVDVPFARNGRQPQIALMVHAVERPDECLIRLPQQQPGIARLFTVGEWIDKMLIQQLTGKIPRLGPSDTFY